MQPDEQPDYSFITETANHKKKGLNLTSNKQRWLVYAAGGGIGLVLIMLLFTLVFGGGGGNTEKLVTLVGQQNELIRVSDIGVKDSTSSETKNFASTVNLSLVSAQKQLSDRVVKSGRKLNAKELAAGKNSQTDTTLTQAKQVNQFDKVFGTTIKASLESYQAALSEAYNASPSQTEKTLLQELYNQAKILTNTVPAT